MLRVNFLICIIGLVSSVPVRNPMEGNTLSNYQFLLNITKHFIFKGDLFEGDIAGVDQNVCKQTKFLFY
jgi:hypothetical protein